MKKLILLLIVFFSILSCSIEDIEATQTTENNNNATANNNVQNETSSFAEVDPTKVKPPTGG